MGSRPPLVPMLRIAHSRVAVASLRCMAAVMRCIVLA
jgi:hypothetical protein